jgi:creatinine amidohydrolase
MERQIQRLSWTKTQNLVPAKINTVLLPIGTVEAHGAAALGTDNLIPEYLARTQAERLNALVAPTLNYGITRSLYMYPGSVTIRPEHFAPFVSDILTSLADHRFKHIIIFNGHGGNNAALKDAAYDIHYRRGVFVAVIHWWQLVADLTKEFFGQAGGHAAIDETACMQALDPALVDKDEYTKAMTYLINSGADVFPSPGSVLLYEKDQGYPTFDAEQAKAYLPKVAAAVGDFALSVLEQWKQLER